MEMTSTWEMWPLTRKEKLIKDLIDLYSIDHTYEELGELFEQKMEEHLNGS